ncbi:hypothetical protein XH87_27725 [Bradyrhizobium sp. CCBAU 53415]|nr:hypothetical protein [Bradyrhizobium sp. CCBAU 53415]
MWIPDEYGDEPDAQGTKSAWQLPNERDPPPQQFGSTNDPMNKRAALWPARSEPVQLKHDQR